MEALRVVSAPPQADAGAAIELFGSFLLGGDEFALPALCIREVVNFPERMTSLPLAPPYLEGMFTLRGSVIPVVNLGRLFDPAAPAAEALNKIAIIDYQDAQVGLLVHATGEILRVRPEQRSRLRYAEGSAQGVVAGTILLEEGRRLVQVLDIERLVRIENVPQVQSMRASGAETRRQLRVVGERRHAISFRAAGARFAMEMKAIQEIVRVPELSESILASTLCRGRMQFRGMQVPVVDFAALAGGQPALADAGQRILVAHIGEATLGFLVDEVESILHFSSDEVLAIPLLSKERSAMFAGCVARAGEEDVILLDHDGIFSRSEIGEMDLGHRQLYPAQARPAAAGQRAGRKVYLSFRVGELFALELKQVREIIDHAGDISHPPGMPDYLCGVLNLRQQLISLVDLRRLYGMAAGEGAGKVLVIEREEGRYGLLVDAVADIVTVDDGKRFAAPSLMKTSAIAQGLSAESNEVVELPQADGSTHSTCLLDLERVMKRILHVA
ncbi:MULTISPECIES: chemotaxis protein CheW [unclassified Duganella]|uniref:chemotaxis protein CheW n=1 Tax=unclassified Duganella TaxID=2636909 RepID=UPI0006F420A5|nr:MULTISPECIES: chemotaxis protein CheW [unclassified Duganella]KQV53755.1 chemotaxis protein CheW [Duganella sp. Root336D2]KRB83688.1 chemotaxis protein CheW [Duganella sp. Root198D2]